VEDRCSSSWNELDVVVVVAAAAAAAAAAVVTFLSDSYQQTSSRH